MHILLIILLLQFKGFITSKKKKEEDIKTNALVVCLVFHSNIFLVFKLPEPEVPELQV